MLKNRCYSRFLSGIYIKDVLCFTPKPPMIDIKVQRFTPILFTPSSLFSACAMLIIKTKTIKDNLKIIIVVVIIFIEHY